MTYAKNVWATGDSIAADPLNHLEQGISDAHDLVAAAQASANDAAAVAAAAATPAQVNSTVNSQVATAIAPLASTSQLNAAVAPLATKTYVDGAVAGIAPSAPTVATIPAGSTLTVDKDPVTGWPARPTARADVTVAWRGPDPSPPIVSSGTGGMLDNVDYRLVTS